MAESCVCCGACAGDADAFRALGTSAAEEQHWLQSARAFERAAELHAVAVDRQEHVECLLLAAKQWLNATAEARALQRRERKQQLQEELGLGGSSTEQQAGGEAAAVAGGKGAGSGVDEKVQPGQQQVRRERELFPQLLSRLHQPLPCWLNLDGMLFGNCCTVLLVLLDDTSNKCALHIQGHALLCFTELNPALGACQPSLHCI
jgi:hypothetical protein